MKKNFLFIAFLFLHFFSFSQGKPDSTFSIKLDSLELKFADMADSVRADLYMNLATGCFNEQPYVADDYTDSSITWAENNDNYKLLSQGYYIKGLIRMKQTRYEQAIIYFFRSLEYSRITGDKKKMADINNNFSIAYLKMGNFDRANYFLGKADKILTEIGDKESLLTVKITQATILIEKNDTDKAMDILNNMLIETDGFPEINVNVLLNIGKIYSLRQNTDNALAVFEKAKKILEPINDYYLESVIDYNIGDQYLKKIMPDKAIEFFNKSIVLSESIKNFEIAQQSKKGLSNAYLLKNDYKNSLLYFKEFYVLKNNTDSINNKTFIGKLEDENKFKTAKLESRLQQAQNKIKFNLEKSIKVQQYIINSVLAFFSILILILLILYSNKISAYKKLIEKQVLLSDSEEKNYKDTEKIEKINKLDISGENLIDKVYYLIKDEEVYLNADISRTALAEKLGIVPNMLSAVIKQHTGLGYNEYINEFRIKKAIKIFNDPKQKHLSLDEIAQVCGFKQGSSFTMAFKKLIGVPPSYYKSNIDEFLSKKNKPTV